MLVRKICKEEYGFDVSTKRTANTLWVYAPVPKILNKEFDVEKDKVFDEEIEDQLRKMISTIGRVIVSSDYTPEFFALVVSDINVGIDYTIIGNVLDIKKSYADFLPWTEANRRYVIRLASVPDAKGDLTGKHLNEYDIKLSDFLVEQIIQRIGAHFQNENNKKYFKVEVTEGEFHGGVFSLRYTIKQVSPTTKPINIRNEILQIISYCLKTYDFKNFTAVTLTDLETKDTVTLNKAATLNNPDPSSF